MNITESLIKIIEKDGIVLADRRDVYNTLEAAIESGQFEFIRKNGKNVGFFSWELDKIHNEVIVENLFIERVHRKTTSLMPYINFLRKKYEGLGAILYRNRKKNKPASFNLKRMTLCCSQS